MAIHGYRTYNISPFWDDEYKKLEYIQKPFNDPESVDQWLAMGFQPKITGELADMTGTQPSWNHKFIEYYEKLGWKDIGTAYYRMTSGTVMPTHNDLYKAYIERFSLHGKETTINRALVLLEDWQSGHYLDVMGQPFVSWKAGDVVEWVYDTPHTAANIGMADRYTLQITGHYDNQ
jgi:hypothetical protein